MDIYTKTGERHDRGMTENIFLMISNDVLTYLYTQQP